MSAIIPSIQGAFTYTQHLFEHYTVVAVIILAIWLAALFIPSRVGSYARNVIVVASILYGIYQFYRKQYSAVVLAIIVILVLAVVRLLFYFIVTARQNRINAKIEARALEKARQRRGTWEGRQGYSGTNGPGYQKDFREDEGLEDEYLEDEEPREQVSTSVGMTRQQVKDALDKLQDLRDSGVLTEKEYKKKKDELYARLG